MEKLLKIQSELKAPKGQYNSFGKYHYRNCEDILEAVKPLLNEHNAIITITDEVKEIGSIIYIEATATFSDIERKESFSVSAQAGIDPNKKGMDLAQCFGSSSSYARKYALNGLLLIDDAKDSDSVKVNLKQLIKSAKTESELTGIWNSMSENDQVKLKEIFSNRKNEISGHGL